MARSFRTLVASLAVLASMSAGGAAAQDYPAKPVRLLVGNVPGGALDLPTRWIGLKLGEVFGRPVVVEFRGGAAGNIAADAVAKSQPDGHTLLYITNNFVLASLTSANLPFDPIRDFAPVALVTAPGLTVLVVRTSLGVNSVKDFIAYAKKNPGKVTFGSSGVGTGLHLYGEMLKSMAGIDMLHIPYQGAGPAMAEMAAGRLDALFVGVTGALPVIKAGKIVAIGGAAMERRPAMPDLPSIHEQGVTGFDGGARHGIITRAGTPSEVIGRIHGSLARVLAMPETKKTFADAGLEPSITSPAEADAYIKADMVRWRNVIQAAGIKPQ